MVILFDVAYIVEYPAHTICRLCVGLYQATTNCVGGGRRFPGNNAGYTPDHVIHSITCNVPTISWAVTTFKKKAFASGHLAQSVYYLCPNEEANTVAPRDTVAPRETISCTLPSPCHNTNMAAMSGKLYKWTHTITQINV